MRQGVALFAAAAIVAATLPLVRDQDDTLLTLLSKAKIAVTGPAETSTSTIDPPPLTDIELAHIDDRRDAVTAPAHERRTAELTLDPVFQRAATSILMRGQVFEGAIVMTEVKTGRVLVWASYNHGRPRDIITEPIGPSASIFKIVTGAALIEAGVPLNQKHCVQDFGLHGVEQRMLEPDEDRDKYCENLGMAMGRSLNTIFSRLALQHLDQDKLTGAANRLGYGLDIPFDVPIAPSTIDLPEDQLEYARAAAGFWHTTLSPFQATNIALTLANKGVMIKQRIVDRVLDEEGNSLWEAPKDRVELRRVLDERTAWAVARMMEQTVENGTSFKTFHDRAGRPFIPDTPVAGKTGTLIKPNPETLYTWWVGFAPADEPEVALSAVVLNRGPWHIKGTHAAAEMLRIYFADKGRKGVSYPPSYRGERRRDKKEGATKEPAP